ncbi:MAG: hypothetical protein AB7R55_22790, partial [Gemmatimonadales bacterium]
AVLAILAVYTVKVGVAHGWDLLPIFFAQIAELSWPGQFALDFTTFLSLSAIWVAWRHHFSVGGVAPGVVAFFGGMMFLAPYLLVASAQAAGEVEVLLLGRRRSKHR